MVEAAVCPLGKLYVPSVTIALSSCGRARSYACFSVTLIAMPPTVASASVRIQYHSRIRASNAANARLHTDMAAIPWTAEIASITWVTGSDRCEWNQEATLESRTTIGSRMATFHATARKMPPASTKPAHPAIARARGERLWARGSVRSMRPGFLPALLAVFECLAVAANEVAARPLVGVDPDPAGLEAEQVERIGRFARARRSGRPGVHHEGRDARDPVALRGVAHVRLVQVARQKHVRATVGELLERLAGAPDDLVLLRAVLRHVERMVRDEDLGHLLRQPAKPRAHGLDLVLVDASSLERERPRGVDAHDRHLVVDVFGQEVFRHDALVVGERREEAPEDVVQRDIVVARHHELRTRQRA